MNDPKDIVVTISIEKEDNNSSESYIKEESKKSIILSEEDHFNKLFLHLKENLSKRLYKKTIKEIDTLIESKYIEGYSQLWKISILKIRALLKIIKKKIIKYLINYYEKAKLKHHIFGIKKYFNQIHIEFNNFNENNKDSKIINDEKILDQLLLCYFEYIYLISFFYKKIGNIMESISYLSLFIKLYKETQFIVKSKRTIFKIEKCFILLAHIMIYNEDYFSCIEYLDIAMDICLKNIIFQTPDLFDGVFMGDKTQLPIIKAANNNSRLTKRKIENEIENSFGDRKMKKVIINIIHIYFYRGICYENFGKIKNAIKSYIQCLWFLKHFFVNNFKSLSSLIKKILDKSLEFKEAIDFLKKKIKYFEHLQLKMKNSNKKNDKDDKNNQYTNHFYSKKFKTLINKLDKLKIYEIDTVNKFDTKKNIKGLNLVRRDGKDKNIFLSDLRLLNSYLREDFREIIDKMRKIKTYDMDYQTREKIQKLIRKIYFEQNQKKIRNNQKKLMKKIFSSTISCKILNVYKNKNQTIDMQNNRYNSINNNIRNSFKKVVRTRSAFLLEKKRKLAPFYLLKSFSKKGAININKSFNKEKEKINSKYFKKKILNLKKSKKARVKSAYSSQKTKIYEENKELNNFFNKKYIAKRDYIKKLEDRELHFQKSILRLKNTPKTPMAIYNKEIIKQNVNKIYQNKIDFFLSNPINWKENLSDEEVKNMMEYDKLQNSALKSLDNKCFTKYKEEENKQKNKKKNFNGFVWSIKNANNHNKDLIDKLTMGLEELRQKEIIENKNYKKLLKENKKHINYINERKINYNNSFGFIDKNNNNEKYSRNIFFLRQSYSSPQYY